MHEVFCSLIGQLITLAAQQTREFTHAGVPTIPKKVLERGSVLLEELDAPSSVAEFDLVQAKLESETKDTDAGKMEGGCLREFTRFLEKEVRAA